MEGKGGRVIKVRVGKVKGKEFGKGREKAKGVREKKGQEKGRERKGKREGRERTRTLTAFWTNRTPSAKRLERK